MEVKHFNKENFNDEVTNYEGKVLVDFWASWCGPCKMMIPVVDEIAKETQGNVKIGKINVDDEAELAVQYGIMSIPTFILFENGKPTQKLVGIQEKETIKKLLK